MNKTFKYISAGVLLAVVASCDMDLIPKGSISYEPGQQIITNAADLEGYEANIMACFRSLEYGDFDVTSDIMVDYFNAISDYGNNYGPSHRTDNSFTAGDENTGNNWNYPYSYIKNFNIFIEGARVVPSELKADADIARGEAFLARAFAYMHLARHFGKAYSETASTDLCVPLVTVYDQNARPARATVAEIYGQIKSDLDSAAVLLADIPGEVRAQRPTVDAVNFMYARYYIDTKDYANAAEYAMRVINTGTYSLSSTAEEMEAEWVNDSGNEPVMQFYASPTEGVAGHSAYINKSSDPDYGEYYRPYYIPSQKLIDAYDEGDLRFAQWFDGGDLPSFHNGNWYNVDEHEYYVFTKYIGNPNLYATGSIANSGQAAKPFLIGEMYLIAAEAYLESGNAASATEVLNELQTSRGAATTVATQETVHNEWYRETVGEGLRFSCLKRWGQGFSGRPFQPGATAVVMTGGNYYDLKEMAADDYHFQWPVPTYEMQTNLNLVQNEGYGDVSAE